MNKDIIFEVGRIYQDAFNDWVVDGRAYKDIYVGDRLAARVVNSSKETGIIYLDLISIMTYGKVIDFLGSVMTGSLYIRTDSNLSSLNIQSLWLHTPSFETRFRICTALLDREIGNIPEEVKSQISKVKSVAFFSEFMQFNYRYKSFNDIRSLIEKYSL